MQKANSPKSRHIQVHKNNLRIYFKREAPVNDDTNPIASQPTKPRKKHARITTAKSSNSDETSQARVDLIKFL